MAPLTGMGLMAKFLGLGGVPGLRKPAENDATMG